MKKVLTVVAVVIGIVVLWWTHRAPTPERRESAQPAVVAAQVPTIARPSGPEAHASDGPVLDYDTGTTPEDPGAVASPAWVPAPTTPPATHVAIRPVPATATPRGPLPGKVDTRDVGKVAEAFLTSGFTLDGRVDRSPQTGFARAAQWASPAYRPYLANAPTSGGGADWQQLVASKGYTTVALAPVTVGDRPADTPASTIRAYKVTVTTHSDTTTTTTSYAYVTCARAADGTWQVTGYRRLA